VYYKIGRDLGIRLANRTNMKNFYILSQTTKNQFDFFKKPFLVICIALFSISSHAQVCSNPSNVFGLDDNGNIYQINTTTGAVGSVINTASYPNPTPNQSNAIGYNTVNGLFYFFKINPGTGSQQFISYNPLLNSYTTLASSPTSASVHSGCVSFNGLGYFCADVNGVLYYYNILLNTWTTITSKIVDNHGNNVSTVISNESSGDMAIDGLGNLWIITSNSSNYGLYEMKAVIPTTSQTSITVTEIIASTTATPDGNAFEGIAFNSVGQLYMSTASEIYLMKNASTVTKIANLSISGVGNDLTSCSYPTSILPVTWISFTATPVNNSSVELNWEVSSQVNNKGFYILQSTDGVNWSEAGFVAGQVNDPSIASYSFTDNNPSNGVNYFMIKQVDVNESQNFSTIITANIETNSQVSVWPNPANDFIHIKNPVTNGGASSRAVIYDISGRAVMQAGLQPGINTLQVSSLVRGTYIITIHSPTGESYNQKLSIQRP
jgi:hypothetical protein